MKYIATVCLIPSLFCACSANSTADDAALLAYEFNGWEITGNSKADYAGSGIDLICLAVKGHYAKVKSELDDEGTWSQFQNEFNARLGEIEEPTDADKARVNSEILASLTSEQLASIQDFSSASEGANEAIKAEFVKSAVHMIVVHEIMKEISADTGNILSTMGILSQLKGLGEDLDAAKKMGDRMVFINSKLRAWDREISRLSLN